MINEENDLNRFMKVLRKIKNHINLPVGHALIGRRTEDQYLVSYPRSGSTWLRTMLVNIMVPGANSNPDVFNAVIPGVSIKQVPNVRRLASPRLIHSHTYYRPSIKKAVYTIRDGRDVLVSFYHYLVTRNNGKATFEEWYQRYENGEFGHSWERNVSSWLTDGKHNLGDNLLINRFEDMKEHPVDSIYKICTHLNISATADDIRLAVELASLDKVRTIERERAKDELKSNAFFNRGGKSGQWKEYFTQGLLERFWANAGDSMELAGYTPE